MPKRTETFFVETGSAPRHLPMTQAQNNALLDRTLADDSKLLAYVSEMADGNMAVQILHTDQAPKILAALEEAVDALRSIIKSGQVPGRQRGK